MHRTYWVTTSTIGMLLNGLASLPGQAGEVVVPGPAERTVDFTYSFTVKEVPEGTKRLVAWVPVPVTDEVQALIGTPRIKGDWPCKELREAGYGNRYLRLKLSKAAGRGAKGVPVTVVFRVSRKKFHTGGRTDPESKLSARELSLHLGPSALIPVDGKVADEAWEKARPEANPDHLVRARRLYDNIVTTVKYDKTGKGWGRGDAAYACNVRKGNCTDFHSLFIGEARAVKVPARFVMGFSIPEGARQGEIPGYHCWAEFFVDGRGWVPVDASEASQHPEKREAFFGGLDAHRVQFTVGRDILIPTSKAGPVNYSIHPHVEADGKILESVETEFSFVDVSPK